MPLFPTVNSQEQIFLQADYQHQTDKKNLYPTHSQEYRKVGLVHYAMRHRQSDEKQGMTGIVEK